jgi:beta-lactamase regulating signal transducer with metallopeptidase domain
MVGKSNSEQVLLQQSHIIEQQKAAIESIETSATAGATIGSAASKKQPILEQRSVANILLSIGIFSGFVAMTLPRAREHLAGHVASPCRHRCRG